MSLRGFARLFSYVFQVQQEDLEHQLDDAKRTAKEISRRDTEDTAAEKAKLTELQGAMNQKQELMKREADIEMKNFASSLNLFHFILYLFQFMSIQF